MNTDTIPATTNEAILDQFMLDTESIDSFSDGAATNDSELLGILREALSILNQIEN